MRKKRIVLRVVLVSAIVCLLVSVVATVKVWVPEEWRWLAKPVENIASPLSAFLIALWIGLRRTPGDKILLDREEAAILRQVLGGIPWWFVFSMMAIIGVAIWIGTWASWWAGQRYPIP